MKGGTGSIELQRRWAAVRAARLLARRASVACPRPVTPPAAAHISSSRSAAATTATAPKALVARAPAAVFGREAAVLQVLTKSKLRGAGRGGRRVRVGWAPLGHPQPRPTAPPCSHSTEKGASMSAEENPAGGFAFKRLISPVHVATKSMTAVQQGCVGTAVVPPAISWGVHTFEAWMFWARLLHSGFMKSAMSTACEGWGGVAACGGA